jgi:hypothetical protein
VYWSTVSFVFSLLALLAAAGCASFQTPDADLISRVPIVEIGQPKPQGSDYILLVRAGKEVPVKLSVSGSFLSEEGLAETKVKLRQDLYLYKYWSSFDGKRWERSHRMFNALISAGLEPEGGKVDIKFNQAQ